MEKGYQSEKKLERHTFQDCSHGNLCGPEKGSFVSIVSAIHQDIDLLLGILLGRPETAQRLPETETDSKRDNEWVGMYIDRHMRSMRINMIVLRSLSD